MGRLLNCLKLNRRMLGHVIGGRWLGPSDYAAGYDRLAGDYNSCWLNRLLPVTDRMLAFLPESAGHILDLGCGTGYTTAFLEKRYSGASVTGVDISRGMLDEARKICPHTRFLCGDMLEILRDAPQNEYDLIVSAWAIGYSRSGKVIRECARVLKKDGIFLFVVNLRDTLPAVFHAYRRTLAQFPQYAEKALWPAFPASSRELVRCMRRNRFTVDLAEESAISARPPGKDKLAWLLKTGILAGFDQVLPLDENADAAAFFESELQNCKLPFEHHYAMIRGIGAC